LRFCTPVCSLSLLRVFSSLPFLLPDCVRYFSYESKYSPSVWALARLITCAGDPSTLSSLSPLCTSSSPDVHNSGIFFSFAPFFNVTRPLLTPSLKSTTIEVFHDRPPSSRRAPVTSLVSSPWFPSSFLGIPPILFPPQ